MFQLYSCQISLYLLCFLIGTTLSQHGYHYNSFSGPVSGEIRQVTVPGAPHYHPTHGTPQHHPPRTPLHNVDYIAKPDYHFAYGVADPVTGNNQQHEESRDGDVVRGKYTVVEPDGTLRTVTYTADAKNGFQATVHHDKGHSPPHPVPQNKPKYAYKAYHELPSNYHNNEDYY